LPMGKHTPAPHHTTTTSEIINLLHNINEREV
jgi:hypothetical protein